MNFVVKMWFLWLKVVRMWFLWFKWRFWRFRCRISPTRKSWQHRNPAHRAWVAPARDGSYVLGQLRSRTAGVSFRSILDAIVKHYLNDQEIKKSHFFGDPPKSFLTSQNAVFFGTLKID